MNASPINDSTREWGIAKLSLVTAAIAAAFFPIRSFDTFWHLVSGRWILQHRRLPETDPFRFSSIDAPWTDHEWLFQIAIAPLERWAGLEGLIVFRAVVVAVLSWVILHALRRAGAPPLVAFVLSLSAIVLARPRFLVRPELASLLGLALVLALLQELRRRGGSRWVIGIVAVVIVWANAHLGVLVAPVVGALYLVGARLRGGSGAPRRGEEQVGWPTVVGVPTLLFATIGLNPHGFEVLAVPKRIADSMAGLAGVNPEWLPLVAVPRPWVFVFLLAVAVAWAAEWRWAGSIDPSTFLVTLGLVVLTMASVRHRGLLFVGGAFALGESLAALAAVRPEIAAARGRPWWPAVIASITVLALVLPGHDGLLARRDPMGFGVGLAANRYPVGSADAVEVWPDLGNVFHDASAGGYLLWRWYPQRQIFIDGRNEVHPELLREMVAAVRSRDEWRAFLDRYRIDGAIIDFVSLPAMETAAGSRFPSSASDLRLSPRSSLYFPIDLYALVYWDDVSMLFITRTEDRRSAISTREYRVVRPDEPGLLLDRARHDDSLRADAIAELERRTEETPVSQRALRLLAALEQLESE